jgi:hypothetical protein
MENPAQKSIDKQSAMMMLHVLLAQRWSELPRFCAFLKVGRQRPWWPALRV